MDNEAISFPKGTRVRYSIPEDATLQMPVLKEGSLGLLAEDWVLGQSNPRVTWDPGTQLPQGRKLRHDERTTPHDAEYIKVLPEGVDVTPLDAGKEIADSLRSWWLDVASQEVEPLIAKMFEYGGKGRSNDLTEIGRALIEAGVKPGPLTGQGNPQDGYAMELGVYFYLKGKMARWSAAIAEGRPVSDDTLLDIGIYVRMVQRIRAVGGWPV